MSQGVIFGIIVAVSWMLVMGWLLVEASKYAFSL